MLCRSMGLLTQGNGPTETDLGFRHEPKRDSGHRRTLDLRLLLMSGTTDCSVSDFPEKPQLFDRADESIRIL